MKKNQKKVLKIIKTLKTGFLNKSIFEITKNKINKSVINPLQLLKH
jgi:hypothetical protein